MMFESLASPLIRSALWLDGPRSNRDFVDLTSGIFVTRKVSLVNTLKALGVAYRCTYE
jgi:hypothetical protein